jgi:hypothetical protein
VINQPYTGPKKYQPVEISAMVPSAKNQEVVYATTAELARLPYDGLAEGFYLVGSGNTGVAASLATIGNHN